MNLKNAALALVLFFIFWGCSEDSNPATPSEQVLIYDFASGTDNWTGGFADWHPPYTGNDWNFVFERTKLPSPLPSTKYSLHLGGMNRSDDLFMFLKREIKGLEANRDYDIIFELEIASNAPTDGVGVGGPPSALTIKAGAVLAQPDTVYDKTQKLFVMKNIEKGAQSNAGKDVKLLGDIGVAPGQTQYAIIKRDNKTNPHRIKTDSKGTIWVLIGTDSGFEGRSDLYYSQIKIRLIKK